MVSKKRIQDLVDKIDSIDESYDGKKTFSEFIHPFFEELGWNFKTDVKSDIFENTLNAFQIEGVTRFYLKEFPIISSLESFKDEILSMISYAYNKGVTWAIVTNFKETRVYNTESTGKTLASMQHYEFLASEYLEKFEHLTDLTKKQFSLNVLDSDAEYFGKKPKRVPIDKQLLQDLLSYRDMLVSNIIKENSISEKDSSQAAQKILNRLIFIRSCGDRQIENRYLKSSIHYWEENKNKKLIQHLQEIFAYFRGRYGSTLFDKHSCDDLVIDDDILIKIIEGLYQSKQKVIQYNFAQIEHDTLGKIYENYLGTVQQKKDGAYYTPSYISKYICENTIIPYLSKLNSETITDLILEYSNNIEELELKIQKIKILDLACGTGEFLIRAIDVLLEISKNIQIEKEKQGHYTHTVKKKKSGYATFQTFGKDVENQELRKIIKNNIYGIDINEEAIEITQLNLFLKLATSSQQLVDVSKNIRIGNSLVNDTTVDSLAFDWKKEFPEKFDIVIGNPPYVRQEEIVKYKENFKKKYKIFNSTSDLYTYFYEHGINCIHEKGMLGFISSNKFMRAKYGSQLREFLKYNTTLRQIIDFGDKHLFNAITNTVILITKKENSEENKFLFSNHIENCDKILIEQKGLDKSAWTLAGKQILSLKNKIESKGEILKNWDIEINRGLLSGLNEAYVIDTQTKEQLCDKEPKNLELIKPLIRGRDISKYHYEWKDQWIINTHNGFTIDSKKIPPINVKKDFPKIYKHLEKINNQTKGKLEKRGDQGKHWTNLRNCAFLEDFKKEKIIWIELTSENRFAFSPKEEFVLAGAFLMTGKSLKYLMSFLNSKICKFYFKLICNSSGMGTVQWKKFAMERIPIPKLDDNEQKPFERYVEQILEINENSKQLEKKDQEVEIIQIVDKIDQLFYKYYNLNQEEISIIES
jgi:type I restriction-modification system DNA methylase subunit